MKTLLWWVAATGIHAAASYGVYSLLGLTGFVVYTGLVTGALAFDVRLLRRAMR